MARWFGRRPFTVPAGQKIVTFTFDDFPCSSATIAGDLLAQAGIAATYYVALGLAGRRIETGEMFNAGDIARVQQAGHELGCHTFDHCPAWETSTLHYLASVDQNCAALAASPIGATPATHSYPISYPRPATKRALAHRFRACRGGGQVPNTGRIDLNNVSSFFLEQCGEDLKRIESIVGAVAERGGWLVFSTHDVTDDHTRFGCSPAFFARVVQVAVASGVTILPMAKALNVLGATRRV